MDLREIAYTLIGIAMMFASPVVAETTITGIAMALGIAGFGLFCLGVFCNKDKDHFRDWARQRNKQV